MRIVVKIVECLLAVVMILSGITLCLNYDQEITTSALGHALESPALIISFGVAFIVGGVGAIYGMFRKHQRLHTTSLMILYVSSVFGSLVDMLAWGFNELEWIDTLIASALFAAIWLYWKYQYKKNK